MVQFRAVFWDWDATLVDSYPAIQQAYNAARTAFGLPAWTLEETKHHVFLSGRDVFPRMFGENAPAAADIYYKTYAQVAPKLVTAKAGRAALLAALHQAGVPMAVVSNKKGNLLRAEVQGLGWEGYFRALVGSGDASHDKPHAAAMVLAGQQAGITLGEDVLYIGDGPVDADGARAAGLTPWLLVDETHSQNELEATKARILPFSQLAQILR